MLLVRDNPAVARRGIVWISPADPVPAGRMVDPSESRFSVSWQDDEPLEHIEITGAEPAIAWAQKRADHVLIRLGHTEDTYFSAGCRGSGDVAPWPPSGTPAAGWWSAIEATEEASASNRWSVVFGLKLQGDFELGELPAKTFTARIASDPAVRRVAATERPADGAIRVRAIVLGRTRSEAAARSSEIVEAACSAAGKEIPNWSKTAWCSSSRVEQRLAD
jgi:hypothetical protein